MSGLNKHMIIGHLGADPEVRYTQAGMTVANFRVATTERYTDKSGAKQEKTEWHKVVAFNKLADICKDFLHKGSQVYVEGKSTTRKWEDRDGNTRYTTEIEARELVMLGGAGR